MRTLQEILDATGNEVLSYSGRGMLGRECLAVECDNLPRLFANLLGDLDDEDERASVAEAFRMARIDEIGRGIVVYFPRVEFVS